MSGARWCLLTTFYPPHHFGGDGVAVERLAHALARRGHEVTVVCDTDAHRALRRSGEPAVPPDPPGVEVVRLKSALGPLSLLLTQQTGRPVVHAARLRRLLAEGRFDVIHYHNVSLVGGPGLLGYGRAVKLYTAHEHWLVCPTHVLWRMNREPCDAPSCLRCVLAHRRPPQLWRYTGLLARQLAHVDTFIAMSAFSRDKHRAFGFPRPMEVVPGFLPADTPEGDARRPQARPYFLVAGRLARSKGVHDVIPLFADGDGPDLLIAGEGEERAALEALAAAAPRVRFLGRLDAAALAGYYRHAVAVLAPSLGYETFGFVIIEAFRHGTPVVARRLGPYPELVETGGGLLFATREELAEALRRLAHEPGLREALGRAGHAAYSARWTEDAVLPRYLEVVQRAALARGAVELAARVGAGAGAAA